MNGRRSRRKGSRGELAFRDLLRSYGFKAIRTGRGYGAPKDDISHDVEGIHFEVKFSEKWLLPKWLRQAETEAGSRTPVVAFRRSRGRWYVALPAEDFLSLVQSERAASEMLSDPSP
jgi:Holliday junction resolvase